VPVDALVIEVSIFDNSDASFRMRQGEIKKWHFFCESGNPEYPRHCNKASAASEARQRCSRRGNPEYKTTGLLHFVRNDSKGVMNYGSINNSDKGRTLRQQKIQPRPAFSLTVFSFAGHPVSR
jgi:hypothetical protein